MRRLQGAFVAFALALLAGRAAAAEITHVATSGEPNHAFGLDVSVSWDRFDERATITRESVNDRLRYGRTRNAVVPRVAFGLWHDLELHAEMPYVLNDDRTWRFGTLYGAPTGGPGIPSSIDDNPIKPDGTACAGPCPLFPVAPSTTVFGGGRLGDLQVGLAWGIFNDRKDDSGPFWLVGTDLTFPTAAAYEPAKDRGTNWSSPFDVKTKPGPFGERIWKWDVYTVLSRRMGYIDPYVKAHVTTMFATSSTYSNCKFVTEMVGAEQMFPKAKESCDAWGADADAKLPWVAGLTLGTEVVPYEDKFEGQRVSLDLRLFADYTSSQRFFNELTDATGKIHQTEGYLTMGGLAALYLHASRYVSLQATASLATRTSHYLTGETLGRKNNAVGGDLSGTTVNADLNPNYDWRYDAPGRRFRITEVSVFELAASGVIRF